MEREMSLYDKPKITRTIAIDDLTPEELAALFCNMFGNEQARFFDEVWAISRKWPGAGWCQQSCDLVSHLTTDGREAIKVMAAHLETEA